MCNYFFIIIVENNKYMVKSARNNEDCEISTIQTICSDIDIFHNETLTSIIDKMPKLTPQERR